MNQKKKKTGIILAAGIGTRLRDSGIKPLVYVDNMEILVRTIMSHDVAGCSEIIIVLGWRAQEIRNHIVSKYKGDTTLRFVKNEKFHLQNGLSVLCARPYVNGEFLLTMADHILDDEIMTLASNHCPPKGGATLCVDYKIDTIFDMDDATKVLSEGVLIKHIGKKIKKFNCVDTGVFIGTAGLFDAIEKVYQRKGDASLSEGVQLLSELDKMHILDIGGFFWQDVDTPEMLEHAEKYLSSKRSSGNGNNE